MKKIKLMTITIIMIAWFWPGMVEAQRAGKVWRTPISEEIDSVMQEMSSIPFGIKTKNGKAQKGALMIELLHPRGINETVIMFWFEVDSLKIKKDIKKSEPDSVVDIDMSGLRKATLSLELSTKIIEQISYLADFYGKDIPACLIQVGPFKANEYRTMYTSNWFQLGRHNQTMSALQSTLYLAGLIEEVL